MHPRDSASRRLRYFAYLGTTVTIQRVNPQTDVKLFLFPLAAKEREEETKFERPVPLYRDPLARSANRETRNNGARIEGICETVMNKLLDARLYTATAPKSQADRQAGKHVGGWILLSPRARLGKPLFPILFSLNLFRSRSATAPSDARAFKYSVNSTRYLTPPRSPLRSATRSKKQKRSSVIQVIQAPRCRGNYRPISREGATSRVISGT